MKLTPFCITVAVALALSACSTPESRIKNNQAAFASASPEAQKRIQAGDVDVGFTREQVKLALGDPDGISTRTNDRGTAEVWSYQAKGPRFGFGLGVASGGGGSGMSGGVGVNTGGGSREPRLRVIIEGDRVTAVERTK